MPQEVLLISDFNIDLLGRFLRAAGGELAPRVAPFDQVQQTMRGELPPDALLVVWTQPERIIEQYRKAAELSEVHHADVLAEVDEYVALLRSVASRVRHLFVPTWTRPLGTASYAMLDMKPGLGLGHLLMRMNLRLADGLMDLPNAHVLDAERWLRAAGSSATAPKMWYAAKVPYANLVFQEASAAIEAAVRGLNGTSRRLIVLDLDDTLWGGIVGEAGWQGVVLGGHHHEGEAYKAFQKALHALTNRGVQLAIVSKNDEAVALEVLDNHPEMQLRRQDFAGWRINWNDKAANLSVLVEELNLGLSSVVFLDDNPAERARVREALPSVLVPDWPQDPTKYVSALWDLRCFDVPALTRVDRQRAAMYAAERERRASVASAGSIEEWLRTLNLVVTVEPLGKANLVRAAQLLNKTNQLNLATRRLSERELLAWAESDQNHLLTFTTRDRFGDAGLVGIVGVSCQGQRAELTDFLLSCRVMGRRVEDVMLHVASTISIRAGATVLEARFRPTERNRPTREVLEKSRLTDLGNGLFVWQQNDHYPLPESATLELLDLDAP